MTVILQRKSFPAGVTFKITRKEMPVFFVDFEEYLLNICSLDLIFAHRTNIQNLFFSVLRKLMFIVC